MRNHVFATKIRIDPIKTRSNCYWQMTTLSMTCNGKRFRNSKYDSNHFSALTEFALKPFKQTHIKVVLTNVSRRIIFFGRNFYSFIFRLIRFDAYRARATIRTIIILQLHIGRGV